MRQLTSMKLLVLLTAAFAALFILSCEKDVTSTTTSGPESLDILDFQFNDPECDPWSDGNMDNGGEPPLGNGAFNCPIPFDFTYTGIYQTNFMVRQNVPNSNFGGGRVGQFSNVAAAGVVTHVVEADYLGGDALPEESEVRFDWSALGMPGNSPIATASGVSTFQFTTTGNYTGIAAVKVNLKVVDISSGLTLAHYYMNTQIVPGS